MKGFSQHGRFRFCHACCHLVSRAQRSIAKQMMRCRPGTPVSSFVITVEKKTGVPDRRCSAKRCTLSGTREQSAPHSLCTSCRYPVHSAGEQITPSFRHFLRPSRFAIDSHEHRPRVLLDTSAFCVTLLAVASAEGAFARHQLKQDAMRVSCAVLHAAAGGAVSSLGRR
jgi:hypothetical protein